MKWYLTSMRKYFIFSGRARRKEFWFFALFSFVIYVGFLAIDDLIDSSSIMEKIGFDGRSLPAIGFTALYLVLILVPFLAVTVRRLHDIGKSGWMILTNLIPFVGQIWLLVLMVTDSEHGTNKWGHNPKEVTS